MTSAILLLSTALIGPALLDTFPQSPPRLAGVWRVGGSGATHPCSWLSAPAGIAVDTLGRVYLCGTNSALGQAGYVVFSPRGECLRQLATAYCSCRSSSCSCPEGSCCRPYDCFCCEIRHNVHRCPAAFYYPRAIAPGPDSTIYVYEGQPNYRVMRLTAEGLYGGAWGGNCECYSQSGYFEDQYCTNANYPSLAVDTLGQVWLASGPSDWSAGGGYMGVHMIEADGDIRPFRIMFPPEFTGAMAMAMGPPSILNVLAGECDTTPGTCSRPEIEVGRFQDGTLVSLYTLPITFAYGESYSSLRAKAFDPLGRAYIYDDRSHSITKYDVTGAILTSWPMPLDERGYRPLVYGMAVSQDTTVYVVATAGSPTHADVYVFSSDSDADGLVDAWETQGIDGDGGGGPDYVLAGADPRHRDLYVEVDAMAGLAPDALALQAVRDAFAAIPNALLSPPNPDGRDGIALHIERDETGLAAESWDADPWPQYQAFKLANFGTAVERATPATVLAKRLAVRYGPFVRSFGDTSYSGMAFELPSYDFFVSLGHPSWGATTWEEQAGTFMHELGHTLGLHHGGSDDIHFKPNYFSVMNYAWQMPLRPDPLGLGNAAIATLQAAWQLDYSRYARADIDESGAAEVALRADGEPAGWAIVGPPCVSVPDLAMLVRTDTPVDWDRDGVVDGGLACVDANHFLAAEDPSPGEVLTGQRDWERLDFNPTVEPIWNSPLPASRLLASARELTPEIRDALSHLRFDCNGNGTPDDVEIANGTLADANHNGVADDCERGSSTDAPSGPTGPTALGLWGAPNPSAGSVELWFALPEPGHVRLVILDASGRRVRTVREGASPAGRQHATWDGRDDRGALQPPGIYFARLEHGGRVVNRRLSLLR